MESVPSPDWPLVWNIAQPILLLFIGGFVARLFERRPKLIQYLVHPTAVVHNNPQTGKMVVNLHALVVRNAGKKPATNVRLGHNLLPDFSVYPNIQYRVEDLPGGGKELVFPVLAPETEITVQYLYFHPVLVNQINTHVQSDEGTAKFRNVWLVQRYPPWFYMIVSIVFFFGAVAIIYLGWLLVSHLRLQ
jgi:hypothetical protein